MSTTIQAIQTKYAGCRFRSRLEARWAVFFDAMGYKWEFEPQGYVLKDYGPYLPDFWLPQFRLWVEVKGEESQGDLDKITALAVEHKSAGVLVVGLPALNHYPGSVWCPYANGSELIGFFTLDDKVEGHPVFRDWDSVTCQACHYGNSHWQSRDFYGSKYLKAIEAATSARFEFGEGGNQ